MASFFSPDGKLYRFMSWLLDVLKLNLMWLLFSLPILTIGISTIAAYDVALRMVENREGHIVRGFLKAFKNNWKQGLPMSVITLLCTWVVYLDFQIMNVAGDDSWIYLIIGVVSIYIFTFSLLYAYPLLARYKNTLINTIQNSFRISMRFFLRSVVLLVILGFEIALMFWSSTTLIVGILVGPIVVILTVSGNAMHIFRKLEQEPGTATRDDDLPPDA